jgi:hypothetical protein
MSLEAAHRPGSAIESHNRTVGWAACGGQVSMRGSSGPAEVPGSTSAVGGAGETGGDTVSSTDGAASGTNGTDVAEGVGASTAGGAVSEADEADLAAEADGVGVSWAGGAGFGIDGAGRGDWVFWAEEAETGRAPGPGGAGVWGRRDQPEE